MNCKQCVFYDSFDNKEIGYCTCSDAVTGENEVCEEYKSKGLTLNQIRKTFQKYNRENGLDKEKIAVSKTIYAMLEKKMTKDI